jgi:hypothetical protein
LLLFFIFMPFKYLENVKHLVEFGKAKKNLSSEQKRLLLGIIKKNKKTVYGLKYGFQEFKSVSDFQNNVPIVSYEDLKVFVDRIKKGENNVLTKDKVVFFATTSGSTKEPKLIPVTKQRRISFKKELSLWSFNFLRKYPGVLNGKLLYFAGPYREGVTSNNVMFGSISGYLVFKSSWFVKQKLVVPPEIYNEFDFDKKIRMIAKLAIRKRVSQIGFAFPVEVLMFFDYLKKNKASLIQDLRNEGYKFKAKILSKKDFSPLSLWPMLKVVNCIKSDANKPYLAKIRRRLPGILINDPGIYCSEGRISLCVNPGSNEGLLSVTTNFFEFKDVDSGKLFLAHELVKGRKYRVIMTTPEGLYRYDIGDVVIVSGFKKDIPLIKFFERDNYLNIAGELAHEKVLLESMREAIKKSRVELSGFTFLPFISGSGKPRYNVLVEPVKKLDKKSAESFLRIVDDSLQRNILDYRQMRNEFGRLDFPVLSVACKGSYANFYKKRISKGGQQKPLVISKKSELLDDFDLDFQVIL